MAETRNRKLTEVSLSHKDRASHLQLGDHGGILIGDKIPQHAGATCGPDTLGPELVLDGNWNAVHGTQIVAL